jgi:hypothetical protein
MEPKVSDLTKVQEQPKTIPIPAGTPKKEKRMANMLDAVLQPSKVATPAASKIPKDKAEELKMTIDEAAPSIFAKPRPSESKPLEQEFESLPERIALPIPEAASLGDLGYIVWHASGKQLSE